MAAKTCLRFLQRAGQNWDRKAAVYGGAAGAVGGIVTAFQRADQEFQMNPYFSFGERVKKRSMLGAASVVCGAFCGFVTFYFSPIWLPFMATSAIYEMARKENSTIETAPSV